MTSDPNKSVYQIISDGKWLIECGIGRSLQSLCVKVQLRWPPIQEKKWSASPWWANRCHLAMMLMKRQLTATRWPTKPTWTWNTLRALEEAFGDFGGCAVVISHDRWFLEQNFSVTISWPFRKATLRWFWFEGIFSVYERKPKEALSANVNLREKFGIKNWNNFRKLKIKKSWNLKTFVESEDFKGFFYDVGGNERDIICLLA